MWSELNLVEPLQLVCMCPIIYYKELKLDSNFSFHYRGGSILVIQSFDCTTISLHHFFCYHFASCTARIKITIWLLWLDHHDSHYLRICTKSSNFKPVYRHFALFMKRLFPCAHYITCFKKSNKHTSSESLSNPQNSLQTLCIHLFPDVNKW